MTDWLLCISMRVFKPVSENVRRNVCAWALVRFYADFAVNFYSFLLCFCACCVAVVKLNQCRLMTKVAFAHHLIMMLNGFASKLKLHRVYLMYECASVFANGSLYYTCCNLHIILVRNTPHHIFGRSLYECIFFIGESL